MGDMGGRIQGKAIVGTGRGWSPLLGGASLRAADGEVPGCESLQGASAGRAAARWTAIRAAMAERLGAEFEVESAEVLAAVAAHREYWQPAETRVLLVAESHVLTSSPELTARVPLARFGHPQAPAEFVRLVYCLGYGERALVEGGMRKNIGTPQFWKIFAACVSDLDGGSLLRRGEPDWSRRVARKIAVLEQLQRRGVWLLDASPVALYRGSRKKPPAKEIAAALMAGWETYSRDVVRSLAPRAVVFIGKTVFDVLGERVREALPAGCTVDWIYQPQAQLPTLDHQAGLAKLRQIVTRHAAVG